MEDICSDPGPSHRSPVFELLFLGLPDNIRLKFCQLIGLVRGSPIGLNKKFVMSDALTIRSVTASPPSIFAERDDDLSPLDRLGPMAMNALRHLCVDLWGIPSRSTNLIYMGLNVKEYGNALVVAWDRICSRMAEHPEPHALHLELGIKMGSRKVFEQVIPSVMRLPSLLHFSLCLGEVSSRRSPKHRKLQRLVHAIVRDSCPKDNPWTGVFRFFNLPLELQEEILKHIDLVAPAPLHWDQGWDVYNLGTGFYFSAECYTDARHVADSSKFPRWPYPEAFFQVSSAFRKPASRVFYSKNIFRMEVYSSRAVVDYHPLAHENAFLRAFPRDSLQYLSYVHWEFAYDDYSDLLLPGEQDEFVAALRLLKLSIVSSRHTLAGLTIAVDLMTIDSLHEDQDEPSLHDKFHAYQKVLDLMHLMKNIGDFFVYTYCFPYDFEAEMGTDPERLLERRLKGEDYDRKKRKVAEWRICGLC